MAEANPCGATSTGTCGAVRLLDLRGSHRFTGLLAYSPLLLLSFSERSVGYARSLPFPPTHRSTPEVFAQGCVIQFATSSAGTLPLIWCMINGLGSVGNPYRRAMRFASMGPYFLPVYAHYHVNHSAAEVEDPHLLPGSLPHGQRAQSSLLRGR